jgi:hypothetical protein
VEHEELLSIVSVFALFTSEFQLTRCVLHIFPSSDVPSAPDMYSIPMRTEHSETLLTHFVRSMTVNLPVSSGRCLLQRQMTVLASDKFVLDSSLCCLTPLDPSPSLTELRTGQS